MARHYTEAGLAEPAVEYWRRAGLRATKRSANREAATQLAKAIELLDKLPETRERDEQELYLQLALAGPLVSLKSYAASDTELAYARALVLSDRLNDTSRIFPALYGRWVGLFAGGEVAECNKVAEEFARRADRQSDEVPRMMGRRVRATSAQYLGKPREAKSDYVEALSLYDPEKHRDSAFSFNQDTAVACRAGLSLALWHLGFPEQALRQSQEMLDWARELGHAHTLGYALNHKAWLDCLTLDTKKAKESANELFAFSEENELINWTLTARLYVSLALIDEGDTNDGMQLLEQFDALALDIGMNLHGTMFLMWSIPGYVAAGRLEDGARLLTRIEGLIQSGGACMYEPEVFRSWVSLNTTGETVTQRRLISIEPLRSPGSKRRRDWSCAQRSASRAYGTIRSRRIKRAISSHQSTAGSPRASTRPT